MAWQDRVVNDNPNANPYPALRRNRVLDTDSYKPSHPFQYPKDLTYLRAYLCSRGGRYGSTVWFGLQAILMENLLEPIQRWEVEEAKAFLAKHGEPFPYEGWMRVVEKHQGRLPLRIRALPEGSVVPVGVPLMIVENTDPELPWLVSWFETMLMRVWYPTTVATKSYYCKKVILEALIKSADDPLAELPFKLHDFGSRGVSSRESAGLGGMAHLVNFQGSDTIEGIRYANHYYDIDMAAFSIIAAEHSTMVIEGREGQLNCARRVLGLINPAAGFHLAACVSDGFDIFDMVENGWCGDLLEDVKASGGKLVVRPDSGNPAEVNVKICQIFDRKGQMHMNTKKYKLLAKYFGIIQGDGNQTEDDIAAVLEALMSHQFSASNINFGMGGGLLQLVNRDTQKFKYMTSLATYQDGREVPIAKDPVTDPGKRSRAGRVDTVRRNGIFQIVDGEQRDTAMQDVYLDGKLLRRQKFDEVRKNAEFGLV